MLASANAHRKGRGWSVSINQKFSCRCELECMCENVKKMTEWDQKLAKIVAETERHLSSVKVRFSVH